MAMIVTVAVPRERPSLVAKMADGYLAAAVFALDSWAESARLVEDRRGDVDEHGPSAAYGRVVLQREFWQDEANRCEALATALNVMRP